MNRPLRVGEAMSKGRARSYNQDAYYTPGSDIQSNGPLVDQRGLLFAVADGVGGTVGGERASRMAIQVLAEAYFGSTDPDLQRSLVSAVQTANRAVFEFARANPTLGKLCTTLTAAVVRGHVAHLAHVGDSRAYLVRGGTIRQLTRDHSLVFQEFERGNISREELRTDPRRNVILRALGKDDRVEVDFLATPLALSPADHIVLCSDGLSNQVTDEEMLAHVTSLGPQQAAEEMVALVNQRGGHDNITVLVIPVPEARAAMPAPRPEAWLQHQGAPDTFETGPGPKSNRVRLGALLPLAAGTGALVALALLHQVVRQQVDEPSVQATQTSQALNAQATKTSDAVSERIASGQVGEATARALQTENARYYMAQQTTVAGTPLARETTLAAETERAATVTAAAAVTGAGPPADPSQARPTPRTDAPVSSILLKHPANNEAKSGRVQFVWTWSGGTPPEEELEYELLGCQRSECEPTDVVKQGPQMQQSWDLCRSDDFKYVAGVTGADDVYRWKVRAGRRESEVWSFRWSRTDCDRPPSATPVPDTGSTEPTAEPTTGGGYVPPIGDGGRSDASP